MHVKTRAIVLHYVKYGETSIIVCMYTEKFGRQSYVVNSVRTKKPSFPASFFVPLTLLEIDMYYKPGRDIQRVKEITFLLHFQSIPYNVSKSTITLFISEILYKTLKEEEANPSLFDFLFNSIQLLDIKNEGIQNFHLAFLLQYMKFIGIYPNHAENGILPEYRTEFILPADTDSNEKDGLEQLVHFSLAQLEKIEISNKTRIRLLEKILEFYMYHYDQISGIRSIQVLKEVFHNT